MNAISHPVPAPCNDAFDHALNEFQKARAVEDATESGATLEEEAALLPQMQEVVALTDAAFAAMIAIPVADGERAAAKLRAALLQYDFGCCGMERADLNAMFAEIDAVLRGDA